MLGVHSNSFSPYKSKSIERKKIIVQKLKKKKKQNRSVFLLHQYNLKYCSFQGFYWKPSHVIALISTVSAILTILRAPILHCSMLPYLQAKHESHVLLVFYCLLSSLSRTLRWFISHYKPLGKKIKKNWPEYSTFLQYESFSFHTHQTKPH